LWVDDELDITQADMTLTGYNHASLTGTNESQFDIVTEGWNENYLTWDNSPTTSTSTTENVPNKTTTTANSVVDVLDFWNVWQANNTANYGMKFKLQTTTNSYRQQYYQSSSSTTESSRPKIEFKVDLTKSNFLTSSWDLDTELGEVTVDISELCDGVSPYFYYMSTDTIIDLDSLYGFFTDTIIGMDSTIFYSTSTTDLQKTFTHIVSGHYHFAVFDKNGVRLIDETLHIMDDLGFDAQTGLTVSGNEVTASAANSVGSFDLFTTEDNYSEMKIDLLGLSGIQFFGFADLDKTVSTHADLVFGYYLSGTNLYTIDAGVLSSTFVTANTSSDLDIINDRGTLKLMLDGIEHASKVVGANFVYKFGLGAQPANKIGFYPIKFASLKKKYIFTPKNLSNLTCAGDLGSFTFTVNTINTLEGFNSIFTIVHEETGNPIYTNQIALDGVAVPVTMDYLGTPLLPGVYVITIDIDGPTIPFTKKITLGYEASWKTSYQYDLPNSYSVSRSLPFDNTYSNAIAENLDKLSNGWIEFTPVVENFPWSLNQLVRFKYLNFNSTVLSSTEPYFAFFKWKSGKILMCYFDGQNFGNNIINVGDRVKVAYNNNSVSIYVEDVLWTSFATTVFDTPIGVQLLSKTGGNGYNDVITSFGCQDNLIHAKLERKMSGVKYRTVSGKLRFYYDEEYQSQETDLTYKVFGFDDRLNSVLDGVQQPYSVLYGDNRYELDITGLSDGAYILEVQNDKEEVFYLRFIK
jgi:hypothetical protein